MAEIAIQKTCRKCKQAKDLSEFYKQAGTKDGYKYECKVCAKTRSSDRYKNFTPEIREEYIKNVIVKRQSSKT